MLLCLLEYKHHNLLTSTAILRQIVAVSFLIGMSLVDFECGGRERERLSLYKNPIGHLENSLDRRFRTTLYSA